MDSLPPSILCRVNSYGDFLDGILDSYGDILDEILHDWRQLWHFRHFRQRVGHPEMSAIRNEAGNMAKTPHFETRCRLRILRRLAADGRPFGKKIRENFENRESKAAVTKSADGSATERGLRR